MGQGCRRATEKVICGIEISVFLLLSFLILQFPGNAEEFPKPRVMLSDTEFDFGTIAEGEKVAHDFVIGNGGNADLIIQRMVPSCGCTASYTDSDLIKPQSNGKIRVEFDSTGFSGAKVKTVRVLVNDPETPSFSLSLKGQIEPDLTIEPRSLVFNDVVKGQASYKEVIAKLNRSSAGKLTAVRPSSKDLDFELLSLESQVARFRVGIPADSSIGEIRERVVITLEKDKATKRFINVPVFAVVNGELRISPQTLSFGLVEGRNLVRRTVKLENRGNSSFKISDIELNNPALSATTKEIQPGKIYLLDVTLDPAKMLKEELRSTVKILTDSKDQRELAVNVYAILPPKIES